MNNKWSKNVTNGSNALDLEKGVFTWDDPSKIARSLLNSSKNSTRKKGSVYQSAMSMLNFYINRSGKKLTKERLNTLNKAKIELKKLSEEEN